MPWPSSEALLSWPDLLSDPSIMGNTIQKLKRGRASRHLGLEAPLATEEDTLSLGIHQGQPRYFSASGEPPWLGAEVEQQSCCHHHWLHSGQGRRVVGISGDFSLGRQKILLGIRLRWVVPPCQQTGSQERCVPVGMLQASSTSSLVSKPQCVPEPLEVAREGEFGLLKQQFPAQHCG